MAGQQVNQSQSQSQSRSNSNTSMSNSSKGNTVDKTVSTNLSNKSNTNVANVKNVKNVKNNSNSTKLEVPTLENTTKQAIIKTTSNNTDVPFETAKEKAGVYEVVSENYIILLAITFGIIILGIIYFFSQTFRVDRAIGKTKIYQEYQTISSLDYSALGERRLGDFYISSAYNTAHVGYQMYDYTSEKMVLAVMQSGARYLEFNVFNSKYGSDAYPVISMGWRTGEWKMMVVDTPLETIFQIIADNAFKIYDGKEGVNNPDDPIFIGLNLNTNSNLDCLNLTAYLITKYFSDRLLPNTYSYQNSDAIGDITMVQLMGKVAIFSSDGYQGSGLEEIVNYCWDNPKKLSHHNMQRLHYTDIITPGFDRNGLIDFNRKGLTIIVPHKEGDFFNANFNPIIAIEMGCQFIAMEFQYIDANMDYYITQFKDKSFILKNEDLQAGHTNITKPHTTSNTTSNTTPNNTSNTTSAATTTSPQITYAGGF
jgi:Phosphatidylinositol-specific phospholipase C, X domain/Phosphatidylinositol-specific phospholipase C, Y domain